MSGAKNVADKFNDYFKAPFNTYLSSPCTSSFHFQYTNPSHILKIIQGLKPKWSAGYDHLSSTVLKDVADIVSTPLSIIIKQSLCSGIFQVNSNLLRWYLCLKKGDIKLFGNYLCCHQSRRCRKRHMANFMNISHLQPPVITLLPTPCICETRLFINAFYSNIQKNVSWKLFGDTDDLNRHWVDDVDK